MTRPVFVLLFLLLMNWCTDAARACDPCGIYNSIEMQQPIANSFRLGIAEQFTEYGTIQQDGHVVYNIRHQHMASSITQLLGSYDFTKRFSIQASLPYINRRYKRANVEGVERGTEAGIGDMRILGRYNAYQEGSTETFFNAQLLAGVKLPTGNSDRLKEELTEDHHGTATVSTRHGGEPHDEGVASAFHGHDLALGSGSYDFPVGITFLGVVDQFFARGSAIYTIRTAGDHHYHYADDLLWDAGPGYYMYADHDFTIAGRVALSGERKANDSGQNGEIHGDTAISTMFWGPELNFTSNSNLNGLLAFDLPIDINNSGLQGVTSYRVRAGITYRF